MGKVRKTSRLSKSKGKINTTSYGKRNKKKYNKSGYTIKMSNIREKWNKSLSMKTNLSNLGLVYDINSDIKPFGVKKKRNHNKKEQEMEFMDIDQANQMAALTPSTLVGSLVEPEGSSMMETTVTTKRLRGPKARTLHEEFKTRSERRYRKTCHISTLELETLVPLIQKHGTDYSAMFRDKDNIDQLTANQLRKKCEELLKSRESRHLNKLREYGLIN